MKIALATVAVVVVVAVVAGFVEAWINSYDRYV